MKRYVVYDGYVVSPNDGDLHFISCEAVMRLHRVHPRDCICIRLEGRIAVKPRGYSEEYLDTLLKLTPRTEVYIPVSPLERAQYPTDAPWEERHKDIEGQRLVAGTFDLEEALKKTPPPPKPPFDDLRKQIGRTLERSMSKGKK